MFRVFLPVAALALAVSAATLPAAAHGPRAPGSRVENQHDRINQGVGSGQLTHREYNSLQTRLQAINMQRQRDLHANDGTLTATQRANLTERLNNVNRGIYFDKHNEAAQKGVPDASAGGPQSKSNLGPVGNRVENQRDRIDQGVTSGQLTHKEYNNVQQRLQNINQTRIAWLKAGGGHLTAAQQQQLDFRLKNVSNNIYFDKHNTWDQPGT